MPVHSAVLTLDRTRKPGTIERLRDVPWLTLGDPQDLRLPVVADPPDRPSDKALWRVLERDPGVLHIDLVFSDFSDLQSTEVLP